MKENSFGQVLQKIRKDQGLSQEELAFKANLHRTYISDLERDRKSPSLRTVGKLAEVLGLSLSDFIHKMKDWDCLYLHAIAFSQCTRWPVAYTIQCLISFVYSLQRLMIRLNWCLFLSIRDNKLISEIAAWCNSHVTPETLPSTWRLLKVCVRELLTYFDRRQCLYFLLRERNRIS